MAREMQKDQADKRLGEMDGTTLLQHVLETMGGGLFTVDVDGNITSWNRGMEEITGYAPEAVVGQPCALLEGNECFAGPAGEHRDRCPLFANEFIHAKSCRIRSRDGRSLKVLKNARLMRGPDGEVTGAIEVLTDVSEVEKLREEVVRLRHLVKGRPNTPGLVGNHPSMQRLRQMIEVAAANNFSVLIQGETGTGKELVAQAIHQASDRVKGPLVRVSCSALPESLLESELFGHVRGAFTGAHATRKGRFEQANGGTLFLDEVGEFSPTVQKKLLRVLQEREVERVGDNRTISLDIRVISATNRDLLELGGTGEFRTDLYYRLAVIPILVPPLRERVTDIPILADHFIARLNSVLARDVEGFSSEASAKLMAHTWPGNVRELEHAVEFAFAMSPSPILDIGSLPPTVGAQRARVVARRVSAGRATQGPTREAVVAALNHSGGVRVRAAQHLGISRVTLWKWMKRYDLGSTE